MKYLLPCLFLLCGFTNEDYLVEEPVEKLEPVLFPRPLDLQSLDEGFVLETKQIEIEGYPTAFNPSIVKWRGGNLMSFRIRDPNNGSCNSIGLIWLDDEFNCIGKPYLLHIEIEQPSLISHVQDPRLITIDHRLYMVYSNKIYRDEYFKEIKKMYLGEISFEQDQFRINWPECLLNHQNEADRWEKNWVPFEYQGQLLLSYSLNPHRVLWPMRGTRECEEFCSTNSYFNWNWGTLRGGTQAVLDGNEYIAFFHSSKVIPSANSNGVLMQHYFMGAYTFSAEPPFEITKISPRPIVGPHFYEGPLHKTWKPLRVVFPGGLLVEDPYIWVFYGRQDHEIWIAKIDKQKLLNSLVPVQ